MGKRGPAKQPAPVKIARGTYRADRDAPLSVLPGEPVPPTWLSAEAREVWSQVVGVLRGVDGLLSLVDGFSLARYCDDWVQYWDAARIVNSEGMTATSENGAVYQHPAVGIKNKASERMARFEARFGMTPSDRSGLNIGPTKPIGVRTRTHA